jgi:DNA-binding NtrC family response regulator
MPVAGLDSPSKASLWDARGHESRSRSCSGKRVSQYRVLIVDLDPLARSGMCSFLLDQGFVVSEASNCRDAEVQLQRVRPDAVVIDVYPGTGSVSQLLSHARDLQPPVPALLLVGQHSGGLQKLASDTDRILPKPCPMAQLHVALLQMLQTVRPTANGAAQVPREVLDPFLGSSAAILRVRELATKVLATQSPVLIEGETGSGKGVLAKWLHYNGPRAGRPFLDLNCAGLSRELLESELFGHQRGAFTSAVSAKPGLLEVADGGTVFLDEIGDMDLQVQAKLLKVLEDRAFRRLGDTRDRMVDFRLVSATHRELQDLVRRQSFRNDLYYRVNIVTLAVPPLRMRVEDIPALSAELLRGIIAPWGRSEMRLATSAVRALQAYAWPGNVRELRNVLERAAQMADGDMLLAEHLQLRGAPAPCACEARHGTLKQVERAYIEQVLREEQGSIERAARKLGIPRSSLYNKMRRFDIPHGTGRSAATTFAGQD